MTFEQAIETHIPRDLDAAVEHGRYIVVAEIEGVMWKHRVLLVPDEYEKGAYLRYKVPSRPSGGIGAFFRWESPFPVDAYNFSDAQASVYAFHKAVTDAAKLARDEIEAEYISTGHI
jgi:hypothetical protein